MSHPTVPLIRPNNVWASKFRLVTTRSLRVLLRRLRMSLTSPSRVTSSVRLKILSIITVNRSGMNRQVLDLVSVNRMKLLARLSV